MFPGSGQTALATRWTTTQSAAGRVKDRSAYLVQLPSLSRFQVLDHQNYLLNIRADLESLTANATNNGLLAYARNEVNNPTLDLVAEYVAMRNAIDAVLAWGVTNFPNTSGELRVYTFVSQRSTDIALTAPELAAYKAQLNALIATIS